MSSGKQGKGTRERDNLVNIDFIGATTVKVVYETAVTGTREGEAGEGKTRGSTKKESMA